MKGKIDKPELRAGIKTISVSFIENQGQVDKRVGFYAHTFGGGKDCIVSPRIIDDPEQYRRFFFKFSVSAFTKAHHPMETLCRGKGTDSSQIVGDIR